MRTHRSLLLVASLFLVVALMGGGWMVRVGAAEDSYRQAVLFSEILSLVLDNYVDPVETERLLRGAYEGMLGGLDPNGAFLSADEVREWKRGRLVTQVDPGLSVLKLGRGLQVVSIDPGSAADEAGVEVGDQVRAIDGRLVAELSLEQSRRLLRGPRGSEVDVELLKVRDEFRPVKLGLVRQPRRGESYRLRAQRGVAVLRIRDLGRLDLEALGAELDDLRSRGVERMLLDLRNLADGDPREAAALAGWFSRGTLLRLRDRAGRLVESVESESVPLVWPGSISILVNWATAGGSEALAALVRHSREAEVFGQSTYGLGAEPKLYELENGSGLLVSSALWETASGERWNGEGVKPDRTVAGEGETYAEADSDQLFRVLELLDRTGAEEPVREAA